MSKRFDFFIYTSIIGLSIFSLFNIFGISKSLIENQIIYIILGNIAFFLFYSIGISFFRFNARLFFIISTILLIITYLIGIESRGSKRWIDFYVFRFQTSEFLKLFFIIYLADFLSFRKTTLKNLCLSILVFIPPIFLIIKQPDLGNAIVYACIYLLILFFAGFSMKYFVVGGAFFGALLPLFFRLLKSYQRDRLLSFLNKDLDPTGVSYNIIQAIITVGSGQFLGKGLGLGTQSRFLFLPENQTDFAFASLVEQFGMIGGTAVIIFYLVIIYRLIKKAIRLQNDSFKLLFLIGVVVYMLAQVSINIGMNLGIFPVAGIALPIITYGGSSILTTMMLLGLAMSL